MDLRQAVDDLLEPAFVLPDQISRRAQCGARESAELMQSLRYTAGYGALQRARDGGEVVIDGEGLPVARWALSDFDRDVMRRGLDGAAQILEAGGARKVYSSHAGWVSYEPGAGNGKTRERAAWWVMRPVLWWCSW